MSTGSLSRRLAGAAATPARALAAARLQPLRPLAALAGVLLAGGLLSHLLQEQMAGQLRERLQHAQRVGIERDTRRFDASLRQAEASVRRYAELISYRSAELPTPGPAFEQGLERAPDGGLASRRARFRPDRDAGLWIPPTRALDAEARGFFERAREITRVFAQGVPRDLLTDSWVQPLDQGLVIHWPSQPQFLHSSGAPVNRRLASWVEYSSPSQSPEGAPRWTPPAYDPAARKWLISVVAPFYRDGSWAGSVGHDIALNGLLQRLSDHHGGDAGVHARPLYLSDASGALLASDNGLRSLHQTLPKRYRPFLEQARDQSGVSVFPSDDDQVVVAPIPTLSAYAVYRIEGAAIRRSLANSLRWLSIGRDLFLLLLASGGIAFLWREQRHRLQLEQLNEGRQRDLQRFVDSVHHELRTPLSIVTGYLHRLQRLGGHPVRLDPSQLRALDLASEETRRLRRLVDDLLDLSHGDSGRLAVRSVPVDAVGVVRHCCELARGGMDRAIDLRLPERRGGERLTIRGDAERLQQVITNLLENADRHSPADRPVRVSVEVRDGLLWIGVHDDGPGIAEADRERILTPFQRDPVADEQRIAPGLGLPVARLLTEAMGGRLSLESELGRGSSFLLSFPLTASAPPATQPMAAGVPP